MKRFLLFLFFLVIAAPVMWAQQSRPKALILTGHDGPFHDWKKVSVALKEVLAPEFDVTIVQDPEFLASEELHGFDLLVQNYVNWERPTISESARTNLLKFVEGGKGVSLIHFANGAFRDWPDYYRGLARRVWVDGKSGHDAYGAFRVEITNPTHPVTKGLTAFNTTDELYYNQDGDKPVEVLVTGRSKDTGKDEPLAFVYSHGKGRVFQSLLGHDEAAVRQAATLIVSGSLWAAGRK